MRSLSPSGDDLKDPVVKGVLLETEDLGLQKKVQFAGILSREETLTRYKKADILVFPSIRESFGDPLLEAMPFGLPVITSGEPVGREVTPDVVSASIHMIRVILPQR